MARASASTARAAIHAWAHVTLRIPCKNVLAFACAATRPLLRIECAFHHWSIVEMSDTNEYTPPKVWVWNKAGVGRFAKINRPIAGATFDKELPLGRHPLQIY